MADATIEVLDLEAESQAPPKKRELAYIRAGALSASVATGELVYLSRNRKAYAVDGRDAPVFLTIELGSGSSQQSVPYRAIGAALTHDVVPMAFVVKRYQNAGRLDELAAMVSAAMAPALEQVPA